MSSLITFLTMFVSTTVLKLFVFNNNMSNKENVLTCIVVSIVYLIGYANGNLRG